MKWKLTRKEYLKEGIFGEMVSEKGDLLFTLEHSYDISVALLQQVPKVQEGIRPVVMYASPKFKQLLPMLDGKNDKDRFFLIHAGNTEEDSEGCILVGLAYGLGRTNSKMLLASKKALAKLKEAGITELEIVSGA